MTEYVLTVSPDTYLWIRGQFASLDADEMTGYNCVSFLVGADNVPPGMNPVISPSSQPQKGKSE